MDNIEACQRYVEGHSKVLRIYGIAMITSAKVKWFEDPGTYVIMVESENGEKTFGGARIQIAQGKFALPIEDALTNFDKNIHQFVKELIPTTGELCGLWNSREVAGLGIGSIYLSRIGVALAMQLKLQTLFALCAPATVKNSNRVGYLVDERLGDKGTFYYPKEGLVATAVLLNDVQELKSADPDERIKIIELCTNPIQTANEISPRGQELLLDYNLLL
ncbi:MAG: hypothetical protein JWQ38_2286 [Flavipsychrobacter sp.]|nr:hypothetical protein [Flavipsychrobacter sp.]